MAHLHLIYLTLGVRDEGFDSMTDAELGMELYVVVGNCLGLIVHGIPPTGQPECDIPQQTMQRLDAAVGQLPPDAMIAGIRSLSSAERQDLVRCCRCAMAIAVDEVHTLLGADERLIEQLLAYMEAMPDLHVEGQ